MYNYEIEEAEMEFFRDDEDKLWVIDMPATKIRYKEGFEESTAINGVTYCHPAGKDPELLMNKVEKPKYDNHDFLEITSEIERKMDNIDHDGNEAKPKPSPFEK